MINLNKQINIIFYLLKKPMKRKKKKINREKKINLGKNKLT